MKILVSQIYVQLIYKKKKTPSFDCHNFLVSWLSLFFRAIPSIDRQLLDSLQSFQSIFSWRYWFFLLKNTHSLPQVLRELNLFSKSQMILSVQDHSYTQNQNIHIKLSLFSPEECFYIPEKYRFIYVHEYHLLKMAAPSTKIP